VFSYRGACAGMAIGCGVCGGVCCELCSGASGGVFEPPTFRSPSGCSTTELRRRSRPICSAFADTTPHHTVPTPFTPPARRKVLNPRMCQPLACCRVRLPISGLKLQGQSAGTGTFSIRVHREDTCWFSRQFLSATAQSSRSKRPASAGVQRCSASATPHALTPADATPPALLTAP
jgi:hypothetical protein